MRPNLNLSRLYRFCIYLWAIGSVGWVFSVYLGWDLADQWRPFWIDPELSPPSSPSLRHWWGTDELGRDVLIRLFYGTGYSLVFGIGVACTSTVIGLTCGILMSLLPTRSQKLGSVVIDMISSIPFLPLALLVLMIYPGQIAAIGLLKALLSWGTLAQTARLESRKLLASPFLLAGRSQGLPWHRLARKYLLPALYPQLHSFFPLLMASSILSLASLDLFGLGMPIPYPSLSEMFRQYLEHRDAWWLIFFPLVLLAALFFALVHPSRKPAVLMA